MEPFSGLHTAGCGDLREDRVGLKKSQQLLHYQNTEFSGLRRSGCYSRQSNSSSQILTLGSETQELDTHTASLCHPFFLPWWERAFSDLSPPCSTCREPHPAFLLPCPAAPWLLGATCLGFISLSFYFISDKNSVHLKC